VLVPDLLREHARLGDPARAGAELETLLQDDVQAGEVLAVVDVVIRAVVVERERAREPEAIERGAGAAVFVRMRERRRAQDRDQRRDRDGAGADQLSFSR
jgi:hypothetical protein